MVAWSAGFRSIQVRVLLCSNPILHYNRIHHHHHRSFPSTSTLSIPIPTSGFMSKAPSNPWAEALVTGPYSAEMVLTRLRDLLDGKPVGDTPGISEDEDPRKALVSFVQETDWAFKPEAFDAVWQAVFEVAKRLGCTEQVRDATYFWTERYLGEEAVDAIPAEEGDEDEEEGLTDGLDKTWIATAIGDARLYTLGYGYSAFAWNALLDGLGLDGEENPISDSMRIGSCGQLLAAGQRLKLRVHGGGDKHSTPGFAGRYLQALPTKSGKEKEKGRREGEEFWDGVLKALEVQQEKVGERAKRILKTTWEHLRADKRDMTSEEVADVIWPKY
ncbi:hypothetical protein CPB84DRAFT_1783599 [Gymnopilus junonius]|uniref:Uncharacterized protein n=1 Tax=Gymnopilus junonius TaxID=109634 RepID=A0A9P5NM91_GYMJU|nr:hypothetical protein CPB84DRAFT_1783599 [Gymnopilus junonius]